MARAGKLARVSPAQNRESAIEILRLNPVEGHHKAEAVSVINSSKA
jgi:hypothetical protein